MSTFTHANVKKHLKIALNPNITKQDHKKASDFLIEYYGEIYDTKSTHLKPTIVALEHLARNKPTKFKEWFVRPILVRLFIFFFGVVVGWCLNPNATYVTTSEFQVEQSASQ
ncbi:hypothetical protein P3631_19120 [Vibrio parahaemolyticus]|uniref:hypothetical protein n=1 Tax=Vibrio TaxID=662 RepID=UPI00146D1933|nr:MULTISPECIES: hypothetical protein [Vibrio]EIK0773729.1 hypothetical protein [Vibrio alginolyticus]EKB1969614.1 hypothetical protein [Vibrio parahaemolyticus]MDF5089491.1 hypothetical protein [Vibrio parahaemolyticus]MDF5138049.1 hypothetical protein [Vibrio parahaemolyticus]MDW2263967.1 hypothetical protein [Vibrio sp. 1557]